MRANSMYVAGKKIFKILTQEALFSKPYEFEDEKTLNNGDITDTYAQTNEMCTYKLLMLGGS